jgi:hypothetical protein
MPAKCENSEMEEIEDVSSTGLFGLVLTALLLLLLAIWRKPRLEDQIEGLLRILAGCAAMFAVVYGLIKFVRWAWYN